MGQASDVAGQSTHLARVHRQVSLPNAPALMALRQGVAKGVDGHHRTHDTGWTTASQASKMATSVSCWLAPRVSPV